MKTFFVSTWRVACLFMLNCLIFNNLAFSQGCTAAAPRNFMANTVPPTFSTPGMILTWDTSASATGGYRIEVFDASLGRRHFETTVSQGTKTLNVSLVSGRRYLATIRSICGVGSTARYSITTAPASGGRIIIDDVIFLCGTTCPGTANYTNLLAGNSLSWSSLAVWGANAPEKNNRSRHLYLQLKEAASPANTLGERFRIRRDDNNQAVVHFDDAIDNCTNDANITCQVVGKEIICSTAGDPEILNISFGENDAITMTLDPGYVLRYQGKVCTLPALLADGSDPSDEPGFVNEPVVTDRQGAANLALNLTCSPNPATENMTVNFDLLDDDDNVALEIYTPLGVLVETVSSPGKIFAGQNALSVNVGNLSAGAYFLVLRGGTWQSASRFEVY